jgi:hypothetical protein
MRYCSAAIMITARLLLTCVQCSIVSKSLVQVVAADRQRLLSCGLESGVLDSTAGLSIDCGSLLLSVL